MPCSAQMSATAATGSMLVDEVVPTVATTAIGRPPSAHVALDRLAQHVGAHPELIVGRDLDQPGLAQPQGDAGLLD